MNNETEMRELKQDDHYDDSPPICCDTNIHTTIKILTVLFDKLLCLLQEIRPLLLPLPVSPCGIIFSAPQAELSLMRSICIFPIKSFNCLLNLSQLVLLPEQQPRM